LRRRINSALIVFTRNLHRGNEQIAGPLKQTSDLQGYFEFFMRKSRAKQMAYASLGSSWTAPGLGIGA
jgi:hypothetical protein